jgi:hypothetical protein
MNPNKNPNIFAPKNAKLKICKPCDYTCIKPSEMHRHFLTCKHQILTNPNNEYSTNALKNAQLYTCKCGKQYKHRSTLSHHKKQCSYIPQHTDLNTHNTFMTSHTYTEPQEQHNFTSVQIPTSSSFDDPLQANLILELVRQNQEFKQLLMEQNKTMIEVAKNSQINNNTINNTNMSNNNSNNKTFNLQFFLNETCKDAMNMKDFIKSLEMSFSELEKMGEVGFAEGMSRIFVDRLNKLDITKRPIHCSDIKREIIHIKDDNKWERDNANLDRLRKIIKQLTIKNILRVDDWKKANSGCTEYNSRKNGQYLKMHIQALGPVDDDEVKRDFGKIIRRVAETTAIDKKYLCL